MDLVPGLQFADLCCRLLQTLSNYIYSIVVEWHPSDGTVSPQIHIV